MTIKNSDITFVVQGPINHITPDCLNSIKEYFPESYILLSTWKNQDVSGLNYNQLLELDDPGKNKIFTPKDCITLNNNRQLFSTNQGLLRVKTKYAVKMRTDAILTGNNLKKIYNEYYNIKRQKKYSFLKQRVLTLSTFFISSHFGRPVYFHKSDLLDFGLTEDLLKIWPEKLLDNLVFKTKDEFKSRSPATEQFLFLHWFGLLINKKLHINNKTNESAGLPINFWNNFIANNLIIASEKELNISFLNKFENRGNLTLELDLNDWKKLNLLNYKKITLKIIRRNIKKIFCNVIINIKKLF